MNEHDEYPVDGAMFRQELQDQRRLRVKGSVYHVTQTWMAYNTNRIEGSTLSEDQTRFLYETRAVDGTLVPADDVIETLNSFRMFDYMIDTLDQPVTLDRIRHFHQLLKQATRDSDDPRFTVGGWKQRPNTVGGIETSPPTRVQQHMESLLASTPAAMTFDDICDFHHRFETIHPFQDGNGRVGRILMFEQCLRNDIMPFVVLDQHKAFYYRGLHEYDTEPGFLRDTFRSFQDSYHAKLAPFITPTRTSHELPTAPESAAQEPKPHRAAVRATVAEALGTAADGLTTAEVDVPEGEAATGLADAVDALGAAAGDQ